MNEALTYAEENRDRALEELKAYIRIPSISTKPEHAADVQAAAEWTAQAMREAGLENVAVIPSTVGRHPLVYADWLHAGPDKPTVLIYGHFDVQPVEPLELWESDPFEPVIRGDKLVARGASDDKGQAYIHIKAVEAYLKTTGKLPVNVKFIYEGEEEDGGESLTAFLGEATEKLRSDVALISDTGILSATQPTIVYGLRGISYGFIDLTGPSHDLHSGTYGGTVDNPLIALSRIIAKLKGEDGKISIPGFYDEVVDLTAEERTILNEKPFTDAELLALTGSPIPYGEPGYTTIERAGIRPTLDIHGIIGGYTDQGAKTVLPSKAHAKISMRLVPNQDPDDIFEKLKAYIEEIAPPSVTVEVSYFHGGKPSVTDYQIPAMQAARQAYSDVYENPPILTREGGSIPIVGQLQEALGIESILMGFSLPDCLIHSPNENFYLPSFYRGIETAIRFLTYYGENH